MKIVLLNPPHSAIGSRIPGEHLPPLGLLSIGGPLLDDGHDVRLIDADLKYLSTDKIVFEVLNLAPQILMVGHSGSSSVHETILGSSRIVVELGEADQDSLFKVDKIPKSVTHTFHCLDRIVNALNDTCGHPIYKVV